MNPTDSIRGTCEFSPGDRVCPVCGENRVATFDHRHTFEYGSGDSAVTLQVNLPVHRCQACDFEFLDQDGERVKHEAVCRHLGVLSSTDIRRIRKQYRMSRSSFAEITGFGVATLNRWENGVVIQNIANDRYLRLIAIPEVFRRLTHLFDSPSVSPHGNDTEVDHLDHDHYKPGLHITKSFTVVSPNVFGKPNSRDSLTMSSKPNTLVSQTHQRKTVKGTTTRVGVVRKPTKDSVHDKPLLSC